MSAIIIDAALKASILLLLAWGAASALRGSSAAIRHFIWSLAVFGALAMPLFSGMIPASLPVPFPAGASVAVGDRPAAEGTTAILPAPPTVPAVPKGSAPTEAAPYPSVSAVPATPEATMPASRSLALAGDFSFAAGFLAFAWAAGCLVALLWLALELLRLRLILRRSDTVTRGPIANAARLPALQLGLRRMPTLLLGPDDAIPMTWGITRPVVLLPGSAREWDGARLEAVLLHEFGHVRRRDFSIQVVARLACALYWFNPLAWLAAHRLQIEREFACDDLVVASGHEPFGYADSLVDLARSFGESVRSRAIGSLAAGAVRPGQLRDRLVSILDDTRDRRPVSRRVGLAFAGCTLVLSGIVASIAPAPAAGSTPSPPTAGSEAVQVVAPARGVGQHSTAHVSGSSTSAATAVANGSAASGAASSGGAAASDLFTDGAWTLALCGKADYQGGSKSMSHHHETNDDVVRITVEYDSCRSSVEIKGTVSFTRDFTAIERMESGSRLRIEVARDGEPDRRLEAHPGDDGRPEYRWWLDGRERSFDANARAWLSDALVDMFRSSSYLARERAAWIFSSGGASALFAEIQAMSSDHTQGIYLEALLENPAASTDDVRRAVGLAGSKIESDHALGKVLEAAATHSFDSATRDAWLAAARRIQSDHSQGKVFEAALARNDLSTANLGFILDAVAVDIESDHTKGKVYEGLLGHELSGQAMEMLIASSASIKSDHTLSKLLEKVIAEDIDEAQQIALLRVAKGIASDHSLGEVLEHFVGRYELSGRVAAAYDDAVSTIDSSHVRGKIARA